MELTPQIVPVLAASFSAVVAAFSALTAYRGFKLARSIQDDAKSDERIVVGRISHPSLRERSHSECVLQIPLFNKSKRKACVTDLTVYDSKGQPIPVAWSDIIDDLGNVSKRANLVGITDEKTVFVRRNDGAPFQYARILFAHSFSAAKEIAIFDPAADFARRAE